MLFAAAAAVAAVSAGAAPLGPPPFSWATIPRFVHCGINLGKLPDMNMTLPELYARLGDFPLVTLEKFTLQTAPPVSLHEEAKILEAAAAIKRASPATRVLFYHMAWQNFPQFDLYNTTLAHADDGWLVRTDDGSLRPGFYNLSHPGMRAAWVGTLVDALGSGVVDGFFVDIAPQALPDTDGLPYAANIQSICPAPNCSAARQAGLLAGLRLAFDELGAATPNGTIIVCHPTDFDTCNVEFFELFFGTSADHGRSVVVQDLNLLGSRWGERRHMVQARASGHNDTTAFSAVEFLVGAGEQSYFATSASPGWGCSDGWLDTGVPGDPAFFGRALGAPLGDASNATNGAGPPGTPALGRVYTRHFAANTSIWLNLTGGWKHAHQCTRPNKTWPAVPECPQACVWWGDGAVTSWPPGFECAHRRATLLEQGPERAEPAGTLEERCAREVYRLHAFFQDWWNGHAEHTRAYFDEQFSSVTDRAFAFVSPTGLPSGSADTQQFIFDSYGDRYTGDWGKDFVNNTDMAFNITSLDVTWADEAEQSCTVVFQENQQVGGRTGPVQAKRNAATLIRKDGTPNQLAWVMEHETWWPGVAHGSDSCSSLRGQPGVANASIAACFGCTNCLPAHCGPCLSGAGE